MQIIYINYETETLKTEEYDVANLDSFIREMNDLHSDDWFTEFEDAEEALNELYPKDL